MSQTSQLRFANEYSRAPRVLRLQIDAAFALYHKQNDALGVVSFFGVGKPGCDSTRNIVLHPDSFSIDVFAAALKAFESIDHCVLFVRAENVYPPVAALKLLAEINATCEVIRVSAANLSYEYRPLERLIDFASAQSSRCGSCSRSANCSAAALVGSLKTHIVVHAIASDGNNASA
jgi:hypothetical protein